MSYPEELPVLRGRAAKRFLENLRNFELTEEQKKFYKESWEYYQCKPDCVGHHTMGYCIGCTRYPDQKDRYLKKKGA